MKVKVNKIKKCVTQTYGALTDNLTLSVQGTSVPGKLDTLLEVFILASLIFQNSPEAGGPDLYPVALGHGRGWGWGC